MDEVGNSAANAVALSYVKEFPSLGETRKPTVGKAKCEQDLLLPTKKVQCAACTRKKEKSAFSKAQLRKSKKRCKDCVESGRTC